MKTKVPKPKIPKLALAPFTQPLPQPHSQPLITLSVGSQQQPTTHIHCLTLNQGLQPPPFSSDPLATQQPASDPTAVQHQIGDPASTHTHRHHPRNVATAT